MKLSDRIFQKLTAADIEAVNHRALPPPPPSETTIGAVVVMLNRSYQNYLNRREAARVELARQTEELRQLDTIINSLEAALTAAADDLALTAEERELAHTAANARFDAVIGGGVEVKWAYEDDPIYRSVAPSDRLTP